MKEFLITYIGTHIFMGWICLFACLLFNNDAKENIRTFLLLSNLFGIPLGLLVWFATSQ